LDEAVREALDNRDARGLETSLLAAARLHNLLDIPGRAGLLGRDIISHLVEGHFQESSPGSASLRYELLRIAQSRSLIDSHAWTLHAIRLLPAFEPGEEPVALDLLDSILRTDWAGFCPSLGESLAGIEHKDGLQLLRPLLQHAILPGLEHLLAPTSPHHVYLKANTTLRPSTTLSSMPCDNVQIENSEQFSETASYYGLPLSTDWPFTALNELLRSADSEAFKQAPPDWNPSEVQIVRATLLLARLVLYADPGAMEPSQVLLGGMMVFMLEHQTSSTTAPSTDADIEVFRDPIVADCLQGLLDLLTAKPAPPNSSALEKKTCLSRINAYPSLIKPCAAPLELAAKPFLRDLPFYQWYTDLLSVFSSISFGEPTFARILLPPLCMTYPADYRRAFWVDNAASLRLIRTRIAEVPLELSTEAGGVEAFFRPVEEDMEVLLAHARALAKGVGERQEFLFAVTVHHLAAHLWEGQEQGRKAVLSALLGAPDEAVRKVLQHDVGTPLGGSVITEEKERRKNMVRACLGEKGAARIASL
jgi:hypothetical protein